MASTYTSSHQIELIADGEQAGDWGDSTNENWDRIEAAISASYVIRVDVPPGGSTWDAGSKTLEWITDNTADQGSANSEGRSGVVIFTDNGDLGGTVTVEIRGDVASAVPERVFVVTNKLSGARSITFNADPADTGATVTLANDRSALIFTSVAAKGAGTAHVLAANSAVNAINKLQLDTIAAAGGGFVGDLVGNVTAAQVDITGQGDLRLQDTTGGEYVALQAAGTTTSYTLTMPGAVGSVNQVLSASDGAGALAWTTPEVGDLTSVANVTNGGLAVTNGTGPAVTLALDFNDLSAAAVNVAADSVAIIDADASNGTRKESIADLATAMGGTGLTGSSGALNVDASQTVITTAANLTTTGTVATGTWASAISDNSSSGDENVVIGTNVATGFTGDSDRNAFVGSMAGQYATGAYTDCTYVGWSAGKSDSGGPIGSDNTGIGSESLKALDGGIGSTFIGSNSAKVLSSGNYNQGIGIGCAPDITTGQQNTCLGGQAGDGISDGSYNICIGPYSGDVSSNLGSHKIVFNYQAQSNPEYNAPIYGEMDNGVIHFNSSANTATTGVSIQNTRVAGSGFNFLRCIADSDGSPATKFQVRGDGQVQVNGVEVHAADYADMFEWSDGNRDAEDRIGLSVVLDGEGGIRIATGEDPPEDVVGIVSGTACIVGNAPMQHWHGTFLYDDFGRPTDEPNPDYDESLEYIPRQERPEWAIIGMTGRIHLRKGSPAHPSWRKIRDVSAVTEEWLVR